MPHFPLTITTEYQMDGTPFWDVTDADGRPYGQHSTLLDAMAHVERLVATQLATEDSMSRIVAEVKS